MKCYICNQKRPAGGVRYSSPAAVGVCTNCGIGVCMEHSNKKEEVGAPLLCPACAKLIVTQRRPASKIEAQLAG